MLICGQKCDSDTGSGEAFDGGGVGYTRTLGTNTQDCFDVFLINRYDKTIKTVRYGAGTNREWNY